MPCEPSFKDYLGTSSLNALDQFVKTTTQKWNGAWTKMQEVKPECAKASTEIDMENVKHANFKHNPVEFCSEGKI